MFEIVFLKDGEEVYRAKNVEKMYFAEILEEFVGK